MGIKKDFLHSCCLSSVLDGAGRSRGKCTHTWQSCGQAAAPAMIVEFQNSQHGLGWEGP